MFGIGRFQIVKKHLTLVAAPWLLQNQQTVWKVTLYEENLLIQNNAKKKEGRSSVHATSDQVNLSGFFSRDISYIYLGDSSYNFLMAESCDLYLNYVIN